jgi:hypothetical protein
MMRGVSLVFVAGLGAAGCLFQRTCGSIDEEAIGPPRVHLTVLDAATGAPLEGATFSENGRPIPATCVPRGDAGAACAWELLLVGPHSVVVAAPGHDPQTITFDAGVLPGGAESCSVFAARDIDQTVSLPAR